MFGHIIETAGESTDMILHHTISVVDGSGFDQILRGSAASTAVSELGFLGEVQSLPCSV